MTDARNARRRRWRHLRALATNPAVRRWSKRAFTVAVLAGAAYAAFSRRTQLRAAWHLMGRISAPWLVAAIGFQILSMILFARLQRWLLRAGGVEVALPEMVEITLASNALGTSLPGGVAWASSWAFGQLRRRGADRMLAGWVILVAGAMASFALFVLLATGSWVAGSRGPVASLRWLAGLLAAIPVVAGLVLVAAHRSPPVRRRLSGAWRTVSRHVPPVRRSVEGLVERVQRVRPGPGAWAEAFALALGNWLSDAACVVACVLCLGVGVPWRGVLVVYALTQVAASLPITPGGLGVVEGSMAALFVAYGMQGQNALAVVLLWRIVSFWGLVPIGWGAWAWVEVTERRRPTSRFGDARRPVAEQSGSDRAAPAEQRTVDARAVSGTGG